MQRNKVAEMLENLSNFYTANQLFKPIQSGLRYNSETSKPFNRIQWQEKSPKDFQQEIKKYRVAS